MNTLLDKSMRPLAYVHNNIILQTEGFEVIGVILGQCVFGTKGELKGKFVHKTLYNTSGEKIGEENSLPSTLVFDPEQIRNKTWQLLQSIKDHSCPWITPKETWAGIPLAEVLKQ